MSEGDDETEKGGWSGAFAGMAGAVLEGVRSVAGGSDGEKAQSGGLVRWLGVVRSARDLMGTFAEIGSYLARESVDELGRPPETVVDELEDKTGELVRAFPNITSIYEDVDRLDEWLQSGLDTGRGDATLLRYLDWLRQIVDAVMGRAIDVAFGDDKPAMSVEQAERLLARVDELLRVVLERWVIPAILEEKE
jgi:hypothetical protein